MIAYIKQGRSDKNLGKSINDLVRHLPDDWWICSMDIDTIPVYHEIFYKTIEALTQSDYALIGCMTNRIGLKHQLHNGELSQNWDLQHHRQIAKDRFKEYGTKITECNFEVGKLADTIAGFFLLFPKRTWNEVGGFPEGGIRIGPDMIDYIFNDKIKRKGLKIGIAQGLYIFHQYRPDHVNPRARTEHLETR